MQATDGSGDAANYVVEPYAAFADADEARKAVRFERRLELGMEGHRLFDLRRWGVAKEVMTAYFVNETRTITRSMAAKDKTITRIIEEKDNILKTIVFSDYNKALGVTMKVTGDKKATPIVEETEISVIWTDDIVSMSRKIGGMDDDYDLIVDIYLMHACI